MAALVLSVAGAAAGSAVLGPVGAIVGRLAGVIAGNVINRPRRDTYGLNALTDLPPTHLCRGRWVVLVAAPGRMAEVADEIAIV